MRRIDFIEVSGNSTYHSRTRSGKKYSAEVLDKYKFAAPRRVRNNDIFSVEDYSCSNNVISASDVNDTLFYHPDLERSLQQIEERVNNNIRNGNPKENTENSNTISAEVKARIEKNRSAALEKLQRKKKIEESRFAALQKLQQNRKLLAMQQLRIQESYRRAKEKLLAKKQHP